MSAATVTDVWTRVRFTGRLELERFGPTPFADVPPSPYYVPSPGSFRSMDAWLDDDGQHVVSAHDCRDVRDVHVLRWPTWQAVGEQVLPSYSCDACGLHGFFSITREFVGDPS